MGSGHITEVYRNLEEQLGKKHELLQMLESNEENKKRVEGIIQAQQLGLSFQPSSSGNIWENTENLRKNIERADQKISLYHRVAAERQNVPSFRMR